jgi:HAD superfamily hydrolase (TIGR01509 family)
MHERIRAVIFDFDGVLVDSEPLHEWAIRESVRPMGWAFTRERFFAEIVGRGDENAYRRIAEWNGSAVADERIGELLREKWRLMGEGIAAGKYSVQPGAPEQVRAAKGRGPIAVCSGSVGSTVRPMLERIGLLGLLDAVVCGDDVARMKPAPDGYLLAAKKLGVEPGACLAIEDTPTGVKAAKNAGMRVVAVCHTVGREMLAEADVVVERISDWAWRS